MKVSELVPKQGNVDVVLEIVEVGPAREFAKFGKPGKVATAVGRDDTGEVKVSLWNEQVEQVKAGDRVQIKNGYVSEWQGEKQLSTGRMGTLEVVKPSAEQLVNEADESTGSSEKPEAAEENLDDSEISEEDVKD